MKVLIQFKAGKPYNISATIAAYGFTQRGYEVFPFTVEEIETWSFQKKSVVVGGVGTGDKIKAQEEAQTIDSPGFLNQV